MLRISSSACSILPAKEDKSSNEGTKLTTLVKVLHLFGDSRLSELVFHHGGKYKISTFSRSCYGHALALHHLSSIVLCDPAVTKVFFQRPVSRYQFPL